MEQEVFFEPGQGIPVSACGSSMLFTAVTVRERGKGVRFRISPPPESAPDVEYHWRP